MGPLALKRSMFYLSVLLSEKSPPVVKRLLYLSYVLFPFQITFRYLCFLNFNGSKTHLMALLKCRFWLSRSDWGLRFSVPSGCKETLPCSPGVGPRQGQPAGCESVQAFQECYVSVLFRAPSA